MPGIIGIISQSTAEQPSRLLHAMVGTMMHEDFYKFGTCSVPEIGTYAAFVGFKDSADGI